MPRDKHTVRRYFILAQAMTMSAFMYCMSLVIPCWIVAAEQRVSKRAARTDIYTDYVASSLREVLGGCEDVNGDNAWNDRLQALDSRCLALALFRRTGFLTEDRVVDTPTRAIVDHWLKLWDGLQPNQIVFSTF